MRAIRTLLVAWAMLAVTEAWASAPDGTLCAAAIRRAEVDAALPPGLLGAVAVSESGKYDRDQGGASPWPWTVNSEGDGRYFPTKEAAIAHVDQLRAAGRRIIDVGCMQINLMHHPDAFASLNDAFEPASNVAYGADFLGRLRDETGSWTRAVERYHTADPERGRAYREKVYERWQEARLGVPASVDHPRGTRMAMASATMPERPAAISAPLPVPAEPRRLQPLSGRGFVSFGGDQPRLAILRPSGMGQLQPLSHRGFVSFVGEQRRVAVLQPPPPSQLRPIVRLPSRSAGGLVRLMPLRRTSWTAPP